MWSISTIRDLIVLLVIAAACSLGGGRSAPPPPSVVDRGSALAPGSTWHWQLNGAIDVGLNVDMYDVDLFETPESIVAQLHARGRTVICYLSAGSWEEWRPDASMFSTDLLGEPLAGWEGERWLDIRSLDVLGPIMEQRLDLCAAKGFDGVEPDNVDGWQNETGFEITQADQLAFNRFLADAAHARGLSIGLKNDLDQVVELEPSFDWALVEECVLYNECDKAAPFVDAGKAVFHVEYEGELADVCGSTEDLRFSSMLKRMEVDAWSVPCW